MPEIFQDINWVDILFVILLMGMGYKGSRIGVGGQILSLACWVVLVFVAVGYYSALSEAIFGFLLQKWAKPISFFVISIIMFICTKILEKVFNVEGGEEISPLERIGGTLVAALRAFMLFGIVSILLILTPLPNVRQLFTQGSKTSMFFVEMDVEIYSKIAKVIGITKEDKKEEMMVRIISSAGS